VTGTVSVSAALILELLLGSGTYQPQPLRIAAYLVILLLVWDARRRGNRVEVLTLGSAVLLCVLSLADGALPERGAGFGPGTTAGIAGLVCVMYLATRETTRMWPVWSMSAGIAAFGVLSVAIERPSGAIAVTWLLVAIPTQALAIWLVVDLTARLANHAKAETVRVRIQKALAACSHILLARDDETAIESALRALLDATEADYAYVDVNQSEPDGRVTWRIVHDVMSSRVPIGPGDFQDGNYDDMPWVADMLGAGEHVEIRVEELPERLRSRYEAEGVKSELAAPILIGGAWIGTIGFTDFYRDGVWTDLEVDALMRAADMVGAYWTRERAREGLENLAMAKDRFVASVSHELRTPLTAVAGFSAELRENLERLTTTEIREMVELIAGQSDEVANLVEDLLTVERAAAGNLAVNPVEFDLTTAVASVVATTPLDGKSVVQVPGSIFAVADPLRTRQIVRNLLTNAARYGGPSVRVTCTEHGVHASVTIADDGPGVEGMDAERIFDPYFRSRPEGGVPGSVGLGLAVARQLARLMGGELVYGRKRGWTEFVLTLPSRLPAKGQPVGAGASVSR
jgi:signal transduction histidine kinase